MSWSACADELSASTTTSCERAALAHRCRMPNWQPDWQDVRWNYDASEQAASELRRVATELDRACFERSRAAEQATREWRGVYRRQFDDDLRDILRRGRALAEDY